MADEIEVEADELIQTIETFNQEDGERASDAGDTRQEIGEYLERTGINSKAFANMRTLLKMKKETDQLDYMRSMEAIFPIIARHIRKNATVDAFDTPREAMEEKALADRPPIFDADMDDSGTDPVEAPPADFDPQEEDEFVPKKGKVSSIRGAAA